MTVLTVNEIAEKLKVSAKTVRRLIETGQLRARNLASFGDRACYRVMLEWLEEFLNKREPMRVGRKKTASSFKDFY